MANDLKRGTSVGLRLPHSDQTSQNILAVGYHLG